VISYTYVITSMLTTIVIYPLICAALYYLGAQALITSFLWGRYPPRLDKFMSCSACSGTWYGFLCGALGWWRNWSFVGLPGRDWLTILVIGLCSMIWTPLLANQHLNAMRQISGASEGHEDGPEA
jgi:hypothetical protein